MKKLLALILSLLLILSLCACGASYKNSSSPMEAAEAPASAEMKYYSTADSVGGFGMAEESAASVSSNRDTTPEANPEKIIYSSDVTVETTKFDESISALAELVEKYGGYVQSSSINGADYYNTSRGYRSNRSANYILRIPSSRFSELMNNLSELGNIPYSHSYTENVTAQYYDTEARLTAYTAQEKRLVEMMEKAETVSDVITIEEKLTELRYQIEALQTTLNNWDRRVNYSTVSVNIEEVREYTPEAEMSYGEELLRSFVSGLKDVGRFFKNLLVSLVGAIPTLVLLAAAFFVLRPIFRKLIARRREKKQRKNESN